MKPLTSHLALQQDGHGLDRAEAQGHVQGHRGIHGCASDVEEAPLLERESAGGLAPGPDEPGGAGAHIPVASVAEVWGAGGSVLAAVLFAAQQLHRAVWASIQVPV